MRPASARHEGTGDLDGWQASPPELQAWVTDREPEPALYGPDGGVLLWRVERRQIPFGFQRNSRL